MKLVETYVYLVEMYVLLTINHKSLQSSTVKNFEEQSCVCDPIKEKNTWLSMQQEIMLRSTTALGVNGSIQ